MMRSMVRVPLTENFNSIRPYQVIDTFKDMCALGQFLHVFNSAIDMLVSDEQGKRDTDIVKHTVVFMKFTS